jgi:hypothetical protein
MQNNNLGLFKYIMDFSCHNFVLRWWDAKNFTQVLTP